MHACAQKLGLKKSAPYKILKKRLHFTAYKIQLLQSLRPGDKPKGYAFAVDILNEMEQG